MINIFMVLTVVFAILMFGLPEYGTFWFIGFLVMLFMWLRDIAIERQDKRSNR